MESKCWKERDVEPGVGASASRTPGAFACDLASALAAQPDHIDGDRKVDGASCKEGSGVRGHVGKVRAVRKEDRKEEGRVCVGRQEGVVCG